MLDAYEQKYHATSMIPIRALGYWGDINFLEPVKMTDGKLDWRKIAKRLESIMKEVQ